MELVMRNLKMMGFVVGLLAALVVMTGCTVVTGSGDVETESRDVSAFSRIELNGEGDLYIVQGDEVSLTIEAEDNLLPYLNSGVRGDTLVIGTEDNISLNTTEPIIYRVTVMDLSQVEVNGSATVVAEGLDQEQLEVEVSGSADVTLSGEVADITVSISGSGDYDGEDLINAKTTLEISGSGNAVVNASEELDVDISGSGDVTYLGDPKVSQSVSGSGSVQAR
jgi:hypothetical protein